MKTDYANDKYVLNDFDHENWWYFLETEYPENYDLAHQYDSNWDRILMEEGYRPGNFDINDYFEIYGLPRINARDGIITVDGEFIKRYGSFEKYKALREEFEELKKTDLFKKWKEEQYYHCQDGQCAWCRRKIYLHNPLTHADHIRPLSIDGDNSLSNLVLSCARRNKFKGAKGKGFNDYKNKHYSNSKPSWIKPNKYEDKLVEDDVVVEPYEYAFDSDLDLSEIPF